MSKVRIPATFCQWKRNLKKATAIAEQVESLKGKYRKMSNEDLSNMTNVFLKKLNDGMILDDIYIEAFAVAREAIYRVHGMFAYKVQLIGATLVHFGDIAEMNTGEGKSLTILLVAYVNALSKKGVHIITVNEYLVKRDAEFCAQALNPLNITVGYNTSELDTEVKREMYACDITYTTNSELGFDYLRDNMVKKYEEKVLRGLHFTIIDEADSILIDEARTPLIISGQPKKDVSSYQKVDEFAKSIKNSDYKIDDESNTINLTEQGIAKAENYFKITNLFDIEHSDLVHKIRNALMAIFVFKYGVEYIVKEGKIMLVDHFTGRVLEGRSYNAGLHQAIQAKEKVKIEPENVIVATITYQSFFRLYTKISGLSGTVLTEAEEFLKIYNVLVTPVPTNKPNIRKDLSDYVFYSKEAKWKHVAAEIERIHLIGQPILVGTSSIEDSEELARLLRNIGFKFELLNAKNHLKEAEIVKKAGQLGAITIATNMAGRGTDIKIPAETAALGGLYVIGTDHHESRRVDNQLRGRSARQGDPGVSRFFISLEDELFRRYAGKKMDKASDKVEDEDYFDSWFFNKLLISMQKKVEGINFDTRKNLIDYDIVLSNQRELVYKQRDQILVNKNNKFIIEKMIKQVSKDLVEIFLDKDNPNYVISKDLVLSICKKLIFSNILPIAFFDGKTRDVVKEQLNKIIKTALFAKISLLMPQQAANTINSIMIQTLDKQWTDHIERMSKIKEGVTLRSLEQKSPLNIYIHEADMFFDKLKKNIAHQTVISIFRFYVPNSNRKIIESLIQEEILSNEEAKVIMGEINNSVLINNLTSVGKNTYVNSVNFAPKSPNDMPVKDKNFDQKKELLKKVEEAKVKNKANNE